jgi:hypothetical protein
MIRLLQVLSSRITVTLALALALAVLTGCASQPQAAEAYRPTLSAEEIVNMPPEIVARTLMDRYLNHYIARAVPRSLRLKEYEIHDVDIDTTRADGLMAMVSYSVRPVWTLIGDSRWIAGNGVYERGWVRTKFAFVTIVAHEGGYRLEGMGTGP